MGVGGRGWAWAWVGVGGHGWAVVGLRGRGWVGVGGRVFHTSYGHKDFLQNSYAFVIAQKFPIQLAYASSLASISSVDYTQLIVLKRL